MNCIAAAALAATVLLLAACGASAPPPADAHGANDAAAPAANATGGEVRAVLPEDAAAPASADAGAPSSAGAPDAAAPAPNDECTPIAMDFEKRARPMLKACYREGKRKDPNLTGTIKLTFSINVVGKITSPTIAENTLPDQVAQCMLLVIEKTPMPEASKCPGKVLTIPLEFPTRPL
ncbi:MAG: AgmX/PglI C-terminal domain-containing protein [Polyangiaceae bacterium]|nr:AgmX/PglI C-terminal domain-containing protein [Polyangiaceae bacterium]